MGEVPGSTKDALGAAWQFQQWLPRGSDIGDGT